MKSKIILEENNLNDEFIIGCVFAVILFVLLFAILYTSNVSLALTIVIIFILVFAYGQFMGLGKLWSIQMAKWK